MINAIHQSSLSMALRCGEQFRRRYMLGEIIPPSIAAARGTSLHYANEVNLRQKVKTKKDLPLSDLKDAARDKFIRTLEKGVFLPKNQQGEKTNLLNEGLNQSIQLTSLYRREVAPEINPIEVERSFLIDIGLDLPIAGRIDHEQTAKVDDLKTTTRSWSPARIYKEIQPVFYSIAHQYEFGERPLFRYHIMVALKRQPKHQLQSRTCTDNDYHALVSRIESFLKMLQAGIFLPAEIGAWVCDPKWCGYFTTCRYVGNEPAKVWI